MFFVICRFIFCVKSLESCVDWELGRDEFEAMFLLGVLFLTKVPIFPFTAWLPIVHAEATRVVSVCLRGYIMKLGVLGLMRLCYLVIPEGVFFFNYVGYLLFFAVLCFIFASSELDKKRWLAFLRLSHIVICPLCLVVCEVEDYQISFSYCLGHALSASIAFILFWFLSRSVGRRCWFMLKKGLASSYFLPLYLFFTMCFCASLPFTLQFFCELYAVCVSARVSLFMAALLIFYLFFRALVPLVCLGYRVTRYLDVRPSPGLLSGPFLVLRFLVVVKMLVFLFF